VNRLTPCQPFIDGSNGLEIQSYLAIREFIYALNNKVYVSSIVVVRHNGISFMK
jgi:hypothetical protein